MFRNNKRQTKQTKSFYQRAPWLVPCRTRKSQSWTHTGVSHRTRSVLRLVYESQTTQRRNICRPITARCSPNWQCETTHPPPANKPLGLWPALFIPELFPFLTQNSLFSACLRSIVFEFEASEMVCPISSPLAGPQGLGDLPSPLTPKTLFAFLLNLVRFPDEKDPARVFLISL